MSRRTRRPAAAAARRGRYMQRPRPPPKHQNPVPERCSQERSRRVPKQREGSGGPAEGQVVMCREPDGTEEEQQGRGEEPSSCSSSRVSAHTGIERKADTYARSEQAREKAVHGMRERRGGCLLGRDGGIFLCRQQKWQARQQVHVRKAEGTPCAPGWWEKGIVNLQKVLLE